MKRLALFLFLICSAGIFSHAQQRPLLTDDVDTTPEGAINVAAGVDFLQNVKYPLSGSEGRSTSVRDIRVRIGFASNIEIQIEGTIQNYVAINSAADPAPIPLNIDGNSTNDNGDFILSTKIKLRNETKYFRPRIQVRFSDAQYQ